MCISTCHISLVAGGTRGKVFFGIEHRIQGEGEAMTPKTATTKSESTMNW